jgi:flagellar hook assembly protein FlgD
VDPLRSPQPATVAIAIHDIQGRVVRSLDLGERPAGTYRTRDRAAHWDGRNEHGEVVSSGVYFVEMTAGDRRFTRRIALRK